VQFIHIKVSHHASPGSRVNNAARIILMLARRRFGKHAVIGSTILHARQREPLTSAGMARILALLTR
jgi:hypothetical protein